MDPPTNAEKKAIAGRFLSDEAAKEPERYGIYFRLYEGLLTRSLGGYVVNVAKPAYPSHAEVILSFNKLIGNISQTRADFNSDFATNVAYEEREYAVRALLQASLMIDCAARHNLPEGRQVGDFVPRSWGEQQSFADFVKLCFPEPIHSQEARDESESVMAQRRRLKAWKLQETYKVRLRPTDNLAEHLVFNAELRVLLVFRHVGYLKAHLYRSRNEDIDTGFAESLERGTLPPQLLLEVLDSIQYLLFPNDGRSWKSLAKFTEKWGFDPAAQYYEAHIHPLPEDFRYQYLVDRLTTLLSIVDQDPPLSGPIGWLARRIGARNLALLDVASVGVFLTVILGSLSVIVSAVALFYSIKQYNVAVQTLQTAPKIPSV